MLRLTIGRRHMCSKQITSRHFKTAGRFGHGPLSPLRLLMPPAVRGLGHHPILRVPPGHRRDVEICSNHAQTMHQQAASSKAIYMCHYLSRFHSFIPASPDHLGNSLKHSAPTEGVALAPGRMLDGSWWPRFTSLATRLLVARLLSDAKPQMSTRL